MAVAISFLCPFQNFFRLVLALRQADDQKQDAGDRLARAIIRAEPPDHPSLVSLSLLRPTRLRGVSPPHGEPSTAQKQGEKPFQTLKTLFRSLRFVFKRSSFYKHIKLLLFIQNPFIGISDALKRISFVHLISGAI